MSSTSELQELSLEGVRLALELGASDVECTAAAGNEFSVNVRLREVETIKEASSRVIGLRVLVGKRMGSAYTSDTTPAGLRYMVRSALELADITSEDPFAGLPEPSELGSLEGDLGLYSDDIARLETDYKIQQAIAAEDAALSADPRINNSEGASFDSHLGARAFSNSRGFSASYRSGSCSLSAVPVAKQGDAMERDYFGHSARSSSQLESAIYIGRKAAARVLRRLGSRKVPTQIAPIIFEPRTAKSLLDDLFDAINGGAIYRKASFLADKLGEKIASDQVTIVDDGTIPGLFGTSPYDDEGVPSRRTVVVEKGILKSYLLNTYTARKLGLKTTANAARGVSGNAGVGYGNLYLQKGDRSPEELIASVRNGFYITELIGDGYNPVTGDYSRGAAGVWIENGELAYPVSEVTIAGNFGQMLQNIEAAANDLEFRGSLASPTVLIREMTISGQRSEAE